MNTGFFKEFWRKLFGKSPEPVPVPKFVDLAPTTSADAAGIYFEALDYATTNDKVLNIALTGPYGSGKSSVIKSFLVKYSGTPLELSLASFPPDGEPPDKPLSSSPGEATSPPATSI